MRDACLTHSPVFGKLNTILVGFNRPVPMWPEAPFPSIGGGPEMGLMDLFSRKKTTGDSEQPTAIDYVEWLLKHMLCTSSTELTIDTSRALPGSHPAANDEPPPCIPDARAVVNRLKILSGVTPIKQAKMIEGTFERPRAHHTIVVSTQFKDDDQKSTCAIRLRFRCQNT